MKVEGPSSSRPSEQSRKKEKVSSGGGAFGRMVTGETAEPSASGATQSIASVDVLLAAQTVDDPAQRAARKRMRARADNLLNELEKIRISLLTGTLTLGHVIDIADVIASHREKILDPKLTAILDEVDLRAQIEMAKMRKALDK